MASSHSDSKERTLKSDLNKTDGSGDEDSIIQPRFPLVSNLVEVYMTGISSLCRAIIYFTFIVYFSYNDYDQSSQSPSLMANAKNPLNLYFVKYAWGWTFTAVFLFMVLSNYLTSGTWISERTVKSSCRLAVGTLVWYVFARIIFPYIEEATGVCPVSEFITKKDCYKQGLLWTGFDTSGHCFLLSWNNLFMVEESYIFFLNKNKLRRNDLTPYMEILNYGLAFLMLMGELMMLFTSLYFHTMTEKVFGTLCGLLPWYFMYQVVYKNEWHPGFVQEKVE